MTYPPNKWKLNKRELKGFVNIHERTSTCWRNCVIHHWSKHHMRTWPLHWRSDRNIFERTCEHGVGHPDPDSARHLESVGEGFENIHGCDMCCNPVALLYMDSLEQFGFVKTEAS